MPRKKRNKEIEAGADTQPPLPLKNSVGSMDELTSDEALPQVQEHTIAAVQADTAAKNDESTPKGFDPEFHATDDDGKPKKNLDGSLAKKRGRKSVLNTGEKSTKQIEKEIQDEKTKAENKQSAIVISGILEQAQIKMISEDDFIIMVGMKKV